MTEKGSPVYQLFLLGLSVYVLTTLAVEPFIVNTEVSRVLQLMDLAVCLVFLADFFGNLYFAENRLKYLKWGWIDLVASIPMLDPLRWGRLARVIRILRFLRTLRSGRHLWKALGERKIQSVTLIVFFLTLIAYSVCTSLILKYESGTGSGIDTANDALWWGLLNLMNAKTSIDQIVSAEGQLLTIALNKVGMLLFAYFNALVIAWMVGVRRRNDASPA